MSALNPLQKRLDLVRANIATFEEKYQRHPGSVTLVAVSKGHSAAAVGAAIRAGQLQFGENYIQEAIEKITAINNPAVVWHYIGRIQSKKAKSVAKYFSWAQTIDSIEIAELLNKNRTNLPPLNVCIQVNISNDVNKGGVTPDRILPLAAHITKLPNLKLRGLMTIPEFTDDFTAQLKIFQAMHAEFVKLQQEGFAVDTLSMGMTHDFHAAIAAGSTMVRIGTAIFGQREPQFSYDEAALIKAVRKDLEQNMPNRVCVLPGKESELAELLEALEHEKNEFKYIEDSIKKIERFLLEHGIIDTQLTDKSRRSIAEFYLKNEVNLPKKTLEKKPEKLFEKQETAKKRDNFALIALLEKMLREKNILDHDFSMEEQEKAIELMEEVAPNYTDDNNPENNPIIKACIALLGVMNVYISGTVQPVIRQRWGNYFAIADYNPYDGGSTGGAEIDAVNRIDETFADPLGTEMAAIIRKLGGILDTERLQNLLQDLAPILPEDKLAQYRALKPEPPK